MKKFDLNIEKVLEHWSTAHAVRELIANALDEKALTNTKEPTIDKNVKGEWIIRDFGRGIHYTHLTQNENEEKIRNSDKVIGKFGVGLKDALATLDRQEVDIVIRSKYGDMTIEKSSKYGFDDLVTLHVAIKEPTDLSLNGTEINLRKIKDSDIETAKRFFLQYSGDKLIEETKYGSIYEKKGTKSKIYVNGLCVAEEDNFLFSYNITNPTSKLLKALNRERTNVGRSAYSDRLKAILLACRGEVFATHLAKDLGKIQVGDAHDELQWVDVQVHASKILNAKEDVLFLSADDIAGETNKYVRYAREEGTQVIIVPINLADKLVDVVDVSGDPINTLTNYATQWNESFEFSFINEKDLRKNERKIFSRKNEILNFFPSDRTVKEVLISETMRPENGLGGDASGAWDAVNSRIVIKRSQLSTLEDFAGTLIHELIHAHTGTDDETIDFEEELTQIVGRLAAIVLNNKVTTKERN
ncbi:ATP-binding protein [Planococcus shenhongbingii]|uniref:ATP-binding protein n=1 Tax=Planococcus shenhongbingii TaxID=3058398 RepID=A0ABT8NGS1_9BACL|nr:ATP-binding protein [Planococcus sp. N017]MDN7247091.1 ATP-binding protein [Planococcus sp. N017]